VKLFATISFAYAKRAIIGYGYPRFPCPLQNLIHVSLVESPTKISPRAHTELEFSVFGVAGKLGKNLVHGRQKINK
jgi:hypothetical protein